MYRAEVLRICLIYWHGRGTLYQLVLWHIAYWEYTFCYAQNEEYGDSLARLTSLSRAADIPICYCTLASLYIDI